MFDNAGFTGLKDGVLKQKFFISHATNMADTLNQYFIFRTGDDTLWYDQDGKGTTHAAVMIADLTNNFDLKAADILII